MPIDYDNLWEALTRHFQLGEHSFHGPEHWRRVEENGRELAVGCGADLVVVRLFAVFHDAERENDGMDPDHGVRAGDLAASVHGELFEVEESQLETLVYACEHHNRGFTSEDPTIGCCWDADRLDLPRVRIWPDAEYMSTAEGKRRASQRR